MTDIGVNTAVSASKYGAQSNRQPNPQSTDQNTGSAKPKPILLSDTASAVAKGEIGIPGVGLPPLTLFNADDVAAFAARLQEQLATLGINTDVPVRLKIDTQGKVVVGGAHPDKEAIEALFASDSGLRNDLVQTQNFFLFKKLAALQSQWATKIEQGMSEELANLWLIDSSKQATQASSAGVVFSNQSFSGPFSPAKTAAYSDFR